MRGNTQERQAEEQRFTVLVRKKGKEKEKKLRDRNRLGLYNHWLHLTGISASLS